MDYKTNNIIRLGNMEKVEYICLNNIYHLNVIRAWIKSQTKRTLSECIQNFYI